MTEDNSSNQQSNKTWSSRFRELLDRTFEQWQRSFPFDWRLLPHKVAASKAHARAFARSALLLSPLFCAPSFAQSATVTFYSGGSALDSALTGDKNGVFTGSFFDGQRFLFLNQGHGFQRSQTRFVTLTLPTGPHEITASNGKNPETGAHVSLVLSPDHHYFLRANSESIGALVVGTSKPILQEVTCQVAHDETKGRAPMMPRKVDPPLKTAIDAYGDLPPCS